MFPILANAVEALPHIDGYVYPNETNLLWSVLIVVYPYITGLVAGAFIMASFVRVFNVKALEPVYRMSLLTALAFLLAAPLPLLFHLGHPERCMEMMLTPHLTSPMAMFGFVYAWYLMAVLLLELWLDYRHDFVQWSQQHTGFKRFLYNLFTVGVRDVSPAALKLDHKMSLAISIIGIPSAFLLHGYVGFIFGSVKANVWWGNVLMPIIFILSAMVSGMALCVVLYMFITKVRGEKLDIKCLDVMGRMLFYALVADAAIEALDWIHRLYSGHEEIDVLKQLAWGKLFYTLLILQALLGTLVPLVFLGLGQLFPKKISAAARTRIYCVMAALILVGVAAMRWNVVIGGQLFSKSLRGFTTYKMEIAGHEGWPVAALLIALPFAILFVLVKLFLPRNPQQSVQPAASTLPATTAPAS
jgi:predicted membrane protein